MRSILLVACCLVSSAAAAADCDLKSAYDELAARPVTTIAGYAELERDFIALNGAHKSRVMRLPPSIHIPATAENFAAKADDLKAVARARMQDCR